MLIQWEWHNFMPCPLHSNLDSASDRNEAYVNTHAIIMIFCHVIMCKLQWQSAAAAAVMYMLVQLLMNFAQDAAYCFTCCKSHGGGKDDTISLH